MKKNQIALYSLSVAAAMILTGCFGSNSTEEACSTQEPGWTQDVAPMVTREDGGEAAAVVHAVDVVTSGELFSLATGVSTKASSTGAKSGIDMLTKLFTPNMSVKSEKLAALRAKKSVQSKVYIPFFEPGLRECAYGGTMTVTEGAPLEGYELSEILHFSFNNCVENPWILEMVASDLFNTFGYVFDGLFTAGDSLERVTLNGMLGAEFRAFEGIGDLPAWVGPPSWSCYADEERPDAAATAYLRGDIISDHFTAEFTTVGEEGSMLFSSSMDLYFEDRMIDEFIWNGPTASQMPEPGFFTPGLYLITGADGCLEMTVTTEGGETYSLINMRALGLETVFLMGGPLTPPEPPPYMMKLDGFIEATIEEELSLSLKADDFYKGYNGYWNIPMVSSKAMSEKAEPMNGWGTHIMGYLGSACMDGMLFVEGGFTGGDIELLPENGWIVFLNQAPCNDGTVLLGEIEFGVSPGAASAVAPAVARLANLYVGLEGVYMGTYSSWSALIGENACTVIALP